MNQYQPSEKRDRWRVVTAESPEEVIELVGNTRGVGQILYAIKPLTRQSCLDLLVDDDANLDAPFGCSLEHLIKTVLLIASRRSAQVELRTQPPIENVDTLLGLCSYVRRTARVFKLDSDMAYARGP